MYGSFHQNDPASAEIIDVQKQLIDEMRNLSKATLESARVSRSSGGALPSGGMYGDTNPYMVASSPYASAAPVAPMMQGQQIIAGTQNVAKDVERRLLGTGIFKSHFVNGAAISSTDQEIMDRQFANNWQNALATGGGAAAGFGANMLGGGLVGGLIPGIISGTVAGGVVGAGAGLYIDQMKQRQDNEIMMMKESYRFINPLESNNKKSGVGFSTHEAKLAGDFLRTVNTEFYLGNQDIQDIFKGGLENKLFGSVSDLESFEKNMKKLISTTKTGAMILSSTLSEMTNMLGEMKKAGIDVDSSGFMASLAKVSGSFAGMNGQQSLNYIIGTTQNEVGGTNRDGKQIAEGLAEYLGVFGQAKSDFSGKEGTPYQNFAKQTSAEQMVGYARGGVAQTFSQGIGDYYLRAAMALDENGNPILDKDILNRMTKEKWSTDQVAEFVRYRSSTDEDYLKYSQQFKSQYIDQLMSDPEMASRMYGSAMTGIFKKVGGQIGDNNIDSNLTRRAILEQLGIKDEATGSAIMLMMDEFKKNPSLIEDMNRTSQINKAMADARAMKPTFIEGIKAGFDGFADKFLGEVGPEKNLKAYDMNGDGVASHAYEFSSLMEGYKFGGLVDSSGKPVEFKGSLKQYISGSSDQIADKQTKLKRLLSSGATESDPRVKSLQAEISKAQKDFEAAQYLQEKKIDFAEVSDLFLGSLYKGDEQGAKKAIIENDKLSGNTIAGKVILENESIDASEKRFEKVRQNLVSQVMEDTARAESMAKGLGIDPSNYNFKDKKSAGAFVENVLETFSSTGDKDGVTKSLEEKLKKSSEEHSKSVQTLCDEITKKFQKENAVIGDTIDVLRFGMKL